MVSQAAIEAEVERLLNVPADMFSLNMSQGAMGGQVTSDISVEEWPFEQLPYMPIGYGNTIDVDGEKRSMWLRRTEDGLYEVELMTAAQAQAMYDEHFVRGVIDPIVRENRNPITGQKAGGFTDQKAFVNQANGEIVEPPFPVKQVFVDTEKGKNIVLESADQITHMPARWWVRDTLQPGDKVNEVDHYAPGDHIRYDNIYINPLNDPAVQKIQNVYGAVLGAAVTNSQRATPAPQLVFENADLNNTHISIYEPPVETQKQDASLTEKFNQEVGEPAPTETLEAVPPQEALNQDTNSGLDDAKAKFGSLPEMSGDGQTQKQSLETVQVNGETFILWQQQGAEVGDIDYVLKTPEALRTEWNALLEQNPDIQNDQAYVIRMGQVVDTAIAYAASGKINHNADMGGISSGPNSPVKAAVLRQYGADEDTVEYQVEANMTKFEELRPENHDPEPTAPAAQEEVVVQEPPVIPDPVEEEQPNAGRQIDDGKDVGNRYYDNYDDDIVPSISNEELLENFGMAPLGNEFETVRYKGEAYILLQVPGQKEGDADCVLMKQEELIERLNGKLAYLDSDEYMQKQMAKGMSYMEHQTEAMGLMSKMQAIGFKLIHAEEAIDDNRFDYDVDKIPGLEKVVPTLKAAIARENGMSENKIEKMEKKIPQLGSGQ